MQEHLLNGHFENENEEVITPKDFLVWANSFHQLCQHIVGAEGQTDRESLDKIEHALLEGKLILNTIGKHSQLHNRAMIPASGINRFNNQPKELLGTKELSNKTSHSHYPFKAELGTATNLKTLPMPSRTYLKKKNSPTQ